MLIYNTAFPGGKSGKQYHEEFYNGNKNYAHYRSFHAYYINYSLIDLIIKQQLLVNNQKYSLKQLYKNLEKNSYQQ